MVDLEQLVASEGPFATVALSAPSATEDADRRFEIGWKNARRALQEAGFPDEDLAVLDDEVASLGQTPSPAVMFVRAVDGPLLVEHLGDPIRREFAVVDELPRLAPILEDRQRAIAHVVVEADRTGAGLIAFDAGGDASSDIVEGERLHIHRGHPGGWSQQRFQQRAENLWEANAGEVAAATIEWSRRVGAQFIAVAGDVRAVGFLLEQLPAELREIARVLDAGSPEGIAEETVRLAADVAARGVRELLDTLRTQVAAGAGCIGVEPTLDALANGRVETLLVHDDVDDERRTELTRAGDTIQGRVADVAIHGALSTGAAVHVIPTVADIPDGLAAVLRW